MPVRYELDESLGLIRTTCVGDVTFAEVLDHFGELEAAPPGPNPLDVLLDLSTLSSMPSPEQLRAVSARIALVEGTVRFGACAIVAPRDIVFGLARMFEVFARERFRGTRVCRTRAEAEEWLRSGASDASGP